MTTDVGRVLARAASAIGYGHSLDALAAALKAEYIVHAWQLAHISDAMLTQLGVPAGLAVAIRCEATASEEEDPPKSVPKQRAPRSLGQLSRLRTILGTVLAHPTWRIQDFVLVPDHSQDYKEVAMAANPARYREGLMATLEILILAQALFIGYYISLWPLCPASASDLEKLIFEWLASCSVFGLIIALSIHCITFINISVVSPANFKPFVLANIGAIQLGEWFFITYVLAIASVVYLFYLRLRTAADVVLPTYGWVQGLVFVVLAALSINAMLLHIIFMGRTAIFTGVLGDNPIAPPSEGDDSASWFRLFAATLKERKHTLSDAIARVSSLRRDGELHMAAADEGPSTRPSVARRGTHTRSKVAWTAKISATSPV